MKCACFLFYHVYFCSEINSLILGNGGELNGAKTLKWTKQTTMLLISSYKERKDDFRNPKIKKRGLWTSIKEEFFNHGHTITEEELDRKWRNLKKTYTGLLDNKKSTGRGRIYWEYFEDFQEIYSADKSVHFPQTISSAGPISSSIIPIASSSVIPVSSSSVIPIASSSIVPVTSSSLVPITSSLLQLQQLASSPKGVNLAGPSTPKNSAGPSNATDFLFSSARDEEKCNKRIRNKNLYSMRKRLADLEEKRLEELTRIRLAIEENNRIQRERNELLKQVINK